MSRRKHMRRLTPEIAEARALKWTRPTADTGGGLAQLRECSICRFCTEMNAAWWGEHVTDHLRRGILSWEAFCDALDARNAAWEAPLVEAVKGAAK